VKPVQLNPRLMIMAVVMVAILLLVVVVVMMMTPTTMMTTPTVSPNSECCASLRHRSSMLRRPGRNTSTAPARGSERRERGQTGQVKVGFEGRGARVAYPRK
jgi:hypothetical protein